jgi:NAD(P)-dependent dehydrogenase (short-subunit alcohol dehydrogenase family)
MSDPAQILEKFRLDGKVAVVTGASRGLGRAMALALAGAGADVALLGREEATLLPVAEQIRENGERRAAVVPLDVADLEAHRAAVEAVVSQLGAIDILVNNAGTNVRADSLEYSPDDWDQVTGVNLRGTFFFTQACARVMIPRRRGKILNVASMTSFLGLPLTSAYTATKAALAQLTKLLAVEWAEHNIQVNALAPGWIRTEMTENMRGTPREQWVLNRTPTGRFGEPEELAGAAVFLVSPAADYITGQVLAVDGGILAGSDWRTGR